METKICTRCHVEKPLTEFSPRPERPIGYQARCKQCRSEITLAWRKSHREHCNQKMREWKYKTGQSHPMGKNPQCSNWLGIWVAESVISKYFSGVRRMPRNNPGYDFICSKGHKIDVKSGCRQRCNKTGKTWRFEIGHNKIADYFLCLAFDDRKSLNPVHIWLIPAYIVNDKGTLQINESKYCFSKWAQYEKPLDKVLECCNSLKGEPNDSQNRPKKEDRQTPQPF